MASNLEALARRVEEDPFFLACAIRLYAKSKELTREQVASALGCTQDQMILLSLCRAPAGEWEDFQKGIEEISTRFHVSRNVLAEVARAGQVLTELSQGGDTRGTLAAARDVEVQKDDKGQPGGDT